VALVTDADHGCRKGQLTVENGGRKQKKSGATIAPDTILTALYVAIL